MHQTNLSGTHFEASCFSKMRLDKLILHKRTKLLELGSKEARLRNLDNPLICSICLIYNPTLGCRLWQSPVGQGLYSVHHVVKISSRNMNTVHRVPPICKQINEFNESLLHSKEHCFATKDKAFINKSTYIELTQLRFSICK